MRNCPKCRREYPDECNFCPVCGIQTVKKEAGEKPESSKKSVPARSKKDQKLIEDLKNQCLGYKVIILIETIAIFFLILNMAT